MSDPHAYHAFKETVAAAVEVSDVCVPTERLRQAMFIVAGRIMLRYVYTIRFLTLLALPLYILLSHVFSHSTYAWNIWHSGIRCCFADEKGKKLMNLSKKVRTVAKFFSAIVPTATSVRKAVVTQGERECGGDRAALAHAMSHSVQTADLAYDEATNLQGHVVIGKILNIPLTTTSLH